MSGGTTKLASALFVLIGIWGIAGSACSAHRMCSAVRDTTSELSIVYLSGGDTPFGYGLSLYADGHLKFEQAGVRAKCARVAPRDLQGILQTVGSEEFRRLEDSRLFGLHREDVQLQLRDRRLGLVIGDLPPLAREVLRAIDEIFLSAFGSVYDIRVAGSAD